MGGKSERALIKKWRRGREEYFAAQERAQNTGIIGWLNFFSAAFSRLMRGDEKIEKPDPELEEMRRQVEVRARKAVKKKKKGRNRSERRRRGAKKSASVERAASWGPKYGGVGGRSPITLPEDDSDTDDEKSKVVVDDEMLGYWYPGAGLDYLDRMMSYRGRRFYVGFDAEGSGGHYKLEFVSFFEKSDGEVDVRIKFSDGNGEARTFNVDDLFKIGQSFLDPAREADSNVYDVFPPLAAKRVERFDLDVASLAREMNARVASSQVAVWRGSSNLDGKVEKRPSEVDVYLHSCGSNKIAVIKFMRILTRLGLKEAHDITKVGGLVIEGVKPEAQKVKDFVNAVEEGGGHVELREIEEVFPNGSTGIGRGKSVMGAGVTNEKRAVPSFSPAGKGHSPIVAPGMDVSRVDVYVHGILSARKITGRIISAYADMKGVNDSGALSELHEFCSQGDNCIASDVPYYAASRFKGAMENDLIDTSLRVPRLLNGGDEITERDVYVFREVYLGRRVRLSDRYGTREGVLLPYDIDDESFCLRIRCDDGRDRAVLMSCGDASAEILD